MLLILYFRFYETNVLISAILCVPVFLWIWIERGTSTVIARIVVSLTILLMATMYDFMPGRTVVLLDMAVMGVCIIRFCTVFFEKNNVKVGADIFAWMLIIFEMFLMFLYRLNCFVFFNDSFWTFVCISLVIGIGMSLFLCVKWIPKKYGFGKCVGYFVLFAVLIGAMTWSTTVHLNYALDFSQPKQYSEVIVDKEIDYNRRGPVDYEFKLTIDGEQEEIGVPKTEYYKYDIGDTYSFSKYKGAFGVPFYTSYDN